MPPARSAGLLVYRRALDLEVLLVHMGGPFWARKDAGAWSLPKGEHADDETPLDAALREFAEETGSAPPAGPFADLGEVRQKGGKVVTAYAAEGEFDVTTLRSNTVELEWPPRSGRRQSFPEVARAGWFDVATAQTKLVSAQAEFLDRLVSSLDPPPKADPPPTVGSP